MPQALKIAIVTETFPPEINGVARTIGRMTSVLAQRGHRIQLIRPRQGDTDTTGEDTSLRQVLVRGLPIPNYRDLRIGLPAKRLLMRLWRDERPDVVHVVTEGPLGSSALRAAKVLGLPVASDFHTNFQTYSKHYGLGVIGKFVSTYLRNMHNKADCTMVPTMQVRDQLEALGYRNLTVVGRGIDTGLFGPHRRSVNLRQSWGCANGQTVALYVGRLAPEKNIGLFIRAVTAMQKVDPGVRAVLVGDGPLREKLRNSYPDFTFAGVRTGEDLAAHYASADVFVFPSVTETFGNVTLEAMASGLAVTAYGYAAAAQYIAHGESGLLAPVGQEKPFIKCAVSLALDLPLRERVRSAAREIATELSWDRVIDDLELAFHDVIRRNSLIAPKLKALLSRHAS